jgi:hypothetical protein
VVLLASTTLFWAIEAEKLIARTRRARGRLQSR